MTRRTACSGFTDEEIAHLDAETSALPPRPRMHNRAATGTNSTTDSVAEPSNSKTPMRRRGPQSQGSHGCQLCLVVTLGFLFSWGTPGTSCHESLCPGVTVRTELPRAFVEQLQPFVTTLVSADGKLWRGRPPASSCHLGP